MSYRSDVKSLYSFPAGSPSSNDRVEITGLPTVCWLRALYVSFQGASVSQTPGRIDFVLNSTGGAPSDSDDDWICSVGYGDIFTDQSVVYPDDSYFEIVQTTTTGLYFTSVSASRLASAAITVVYT